MQAQPTPLDPAGLARLARLYALEDYLFEGLPRRRPRTAGDYLQYCQACRQLAARSGLSLRSLDRALWAKSWEDDLLALVEKP